MILNELYGFIKRHSSPISIIDQNNSIVVSYLQQYFRYIDLIWFHEWLNSSTTKKQ